MRIVNRKQFGPSVERLESRQLLSASAAANGFVTQVNLVSDGFVAANHTDPNLKNPWGLAFAPGGPFWVADNNSGLATLYDGAGTNQGLVVTIPGGGGGTANPSGQVFNPGNGFVVHKNGGASGPATFIFVGEDGAISGWNGSVDQNNAILAVDNSTSGAVYKGAALADVGGGSELFITNFHAGTVEVYDSTFSPVALGATAFHDKRIPKGFAPFNVQNVNGQLYVTYAKQDATGQNDVGRPGNGFVDVFDTGGNLVRRLAHGSFLDSPWGVTVAPSTWGRFAGDILVGQFKSGRIDIFNSRGGFVGFLRDQHNKPLTIDRLWALTPGAGLPASDPNTIYFSAGVNDEKDGLFGSLAFTPIAKKSAPGAATGGGGGGGGGSQTGGATGYSSGAATTPPPATGGTMNTGGGTTNTGGGMPGMGGGGGSPYFGGGFMY